jgi:DNA-binding NarL/FixJ family response regulator
MDGIDATREIRSAWPRARILILSDATGESHVRRALKAGASGYLPKNIAPAMLIETLRRVQLGQQAIPSDLALALATRLAERELSQRELEVLKRVALGNPNKRIATELDVTVDTIKAHMKSVLSKLGASDRTHAVTLALRRGLINLFD